MKNHVYTESKEREIFSEKRKSRQPTLQRTEPEPLSNLPREPEGPKESFTAVYHLKWFVEREVGKRAILLKFLRMSVVEQY